MTFIATHGDQDAENHYPMRHPRPRLRVVGVDGFKPALPPDRVPTTKGLAVGPRNGDRTRALEQMTALEGVP